jgi:hypothetical protein
MQTSLELNFATQISQVRTHLNLKKTITSWDAITLYHATRLSAIIYNLRASGMDIVSVWENDEATKKRWVRYTLVKELKPSKDA